MLKMTFNDEGGIDVEITDHYGHEMNATIRPSEVEDLREFLVDPGPGDAISMDEEES